MTTKVRSELLILEGCAHAALYGRGEGFDQKTLAFLQVHSEVVAAKLT